MASDGGPGRFGWESWEWDESVFAGTAGHYWQGRPPYSPALPEAIAAAVNVDGHPRLLDVGCGPGVIALQVAGLFDEVVGLDPDRAMLDEAARVAGDRHITNASWVGMRAEDLPGDLGRFRVISFAQLFHWMDRPRVASTAREMLDPGGVVIHINTFIDGNPDPARGPLPHAPIPADAIDRLRVRYLGADRRAGQSHRNTSPSGEDAIFQAAGFLPEQSYRVPDDRVLERTIDDVVASVLSLSSTAPHLFGEDLAQFLRDLRHALAEASPSGLFSVPLRDNRVRVWRPVPH